jgi:hypothetical protein
MNIMIVARNTGVVPDYAAIGHHQQATWTAGDYAVVVPRCRLWASACGKRSTCAPASACSTSPPATGTLRSLWPAALPKWPRRTTSAPLDRDREALR